MPRSRLEQSRRSFLASLSSLTAASLLGVGSARAAGGPLLTRPIPASGEQLPVIGMGSWITFNVGDDLDLRDRRAEVLRAFFELGGGLVDSSPMYGSSEAVIGHGLERITVPPSFFSATKVWTWRQSEGPSQMAESEALWGVERFDLMQIHNLVNWEGHLETLRDWQAQGRIRYLGITTSHGRRHDDVARIMAEQPVDFVQFTYNVLDREAERRLLPLARERGIAVIVNRPFQRGALLDHVAEHPLPDWAGEIDCANWAQFLLKFIISHPAVTCAIPATSRVEHMRENMGALHGALPDAAMRQRMIDYVENL